MSSLTAMGHGRSEVIGALRAAQGNPAIALDFLQQPQPAAATSSALNRSQFPQPAASSVSATVASQQLGALKIETMEGASDGDDDLGDMSPAHQKKEDDDINSTLDAAVEDLKGHMQEGETLLSGGKRSHQESSSPPFVSNAHMNIFDQFRDDAKEYLLAISDPNDRLSAYHRYMANLLQFIDPAMRQPILELDQTDEEGAFALFRKTLEEMSQEAYKSNQFVQLALTEALKNTMNKG